MYDFTFQNETKIYFGENQLKNLGTEIKKYGKKVLLTFGGGSIKKIGLYDKVIKELEDNGMEIFELSGIEPNPRHTTVNKGAEICKKENIDVILAVGGGSTIDCSKVISAATFYDGDAWDLVVHKAEVTKTLPLLTVLTLSATGSEMDSGGVISNLETNEKYGLLHPLMQPKVSFLDPTVTYSVNAFHTACGSVDIMSHILDVYYLTKNEKMFMVDSVMETVLKTVYKYSQIAVKEPENYEARANLMWASSWALNNFLTSGGGQAPTCHAMEHELSAYYDITHGLGLGILTPRWLEYILNDETKASIYKLGVNVFNIENDLDEMIGAKKTIDFIHHFFYNILGLQSTLTEIGINEENFEKMAINCTKGGILPGYIHLTKEDVINIYKMCL
ncbi:MAG: iron-containing alcohol dehydrogenase [Lachnospirales bacterium]